MFTHRQIVFQMLLMHPTKWPQKVARRGPQPLDGVDMNLAHAVAVVVARPLTPTMADRAVCSLDLVVALPFIRVTSGLLLRKLMYMLLQSFAIRMRANSQAALPAVSADSSHHGWAIIVIGAVPAPLVRAAAWWITRIRVPFAFFPPRSGTSRQFQFRSLAVRSAPRSHKRSVGVSCASDVRSDVTTLTPPKVWWMARLCRPRVITKPLVAEPVYCQRRWFRCKDYRRADSVGSDDQPDHACGHETDAPARSSHHSQNISARWGESISSPTQGFLVRPVNRLSGRSFPKFNMHQLVT